MNIASRTGFVAIIGKPNVGKSTLLNRLMGQKISITSRKPQTTRQRILAVKTEQAVQIIYIDTPGLHLGGKRAINKYMNRAAKTALRDVDVILFVLDGLHWDKEDEWILNLIRKTKAPVILVINKIDRIKDRELLLPFINEIAKQRSFLKIIPTSAQKGTQVDELEKVIVSCLPEEPHHFPPEQITDRDDIFMASELIREKLMRLLGQEVPYALTVTIDAFERQDKILKISAIIWVEKAGQKAIIIGKSGERLKTIGTKARLDLEKHFSQKVFLQLWVKVKSGWSNDEKSLAHFGYAED